MTELNMNYSNSPAPSSNPVEIQTVSSADLESEGFDYNSMQGKGYESVEIPRENLYGSNPGIDSLHLRDVPNLIREKVNQAAEAGHLARTLSHYEKIILNESDTFTPDIFEGLKALLEEGKQVSKGEQQEAWLEKFKTFLNGLRMAKNV